MIRSKLKKEKRKNIYLCTTDVENIFINEYLPTAPGDYVKVYLFGLMYAEQERPISGEAAAAALKMSLEDIEKAWDYWEKLGLIKKEVHDESGTYEITFLSLIDRFYRKSQPNIDELVRATDEDYDEREGSDVSGSGGPGDNGADEGDDMRSEDELVNRELRALYQSYEIQAGRTLSPSEMRRIAELVNEYSVTPDVFDYAIKYSAGNNSTSIEYIAKVALAWTSEGCRTILDVKNLIAERDERRSVYYKVFQELGFKRSTTPGDREMIDKWLDEWGFDIGDIMSACRRTAGLANPSMKYVDAVLTNKLKEAGGIAVGSASGGAGRASSKGTARVSQRVLNEYYEYLRGEAQAEQQKRLEEVRLSVQGMSELLVFEDEQHRRMMTSGIDEKARATRQDAREKLKEIEEKKQKILTENGYPEDYLAVPYKCRLCMDFGVTDEGKICSCAAARAEEAFEWNKGRKKDR